MKPFKTDSITSSIESRTQPNKTLMKLLPRTSQRVYSRRISHQLTLDDYYLEYKTRGVLRMLCGLRGLNTRIEIPTNTIINCQIRYGLFLHLTVQEYVSHYTAVKVKRLKPVFIPNWRLAIKAFRKIGAIIDRNKSLPNSESNFFYQPVSMTLQKDNYDVEIPEHTDLSNTQGKPYYSAYPVNVR